MDISPDYQMHELQQGMQQVQQQLQMLQQQKQELEQVLETILEMKKTVNGQEILVPLGAGVFTRAQLTENSTVILNVGAQIVVEKGNDDAVALIERQMKELQKIEVSLQEEFAQVSQQIQFLQLQHASPAESMQ